MAGPVALQSSGFIMKMSNTGSVLTVESVDTLDVDTAHLSSTSNRHVTVWNRDDGWLPVPGESKSSIMHDRVVVIWRVQVYGIKFPKIMFLSPDDVLEEDLDVFISVTAGLLMVEAQSVEELMLGNTQIDTSVAI